MQLLFDHDDPSRHGDVDEAAVIGLYRHELPAETSRVRLRTNFVTTLDGSVQGLDGRSGSINTPSDQWVFALHRALADAILVGASTVRNEGYRAVDLAPWQREIRAELGLAPYPTLVVVTASGQLSPGITAADGRQLGPVLILTSLERTRAELDGLRSAGAEVVSLPGAGVDLGEAVDELVGCGLRRVVCEGGPRLHRDLLAAGLVDELSLTLAPVAVGGVGLRSTSGAALAAPAGFTLRFALLADDGALFTHYAARTG